MKLECLSYISLISCRYLNVYDRYSYEFGCKVEIGYKVNPIKDE